MCEGTKGGDFIGIVSITLDMDFSLACTHHNLNFEVHRSKTRYFVNMFAKILYPKYLFFWNRKVQFLTNNSRPSFSKVKATDVGESSSIFLA
jgi:hypothetical protein